MPWVESASETFVARHDAREADDAERVLAQLEGARLRLEGRFPAPPGELGVVLHNSAAPPHRSRRCAAQVAVRARLLCIGAPPARRPRHARGGPPPPLPPPAAPRR